MSKFAPWTEAEAAVAAEKYSKSPTAELIDPAKYYAFIAALEWAAGVIAKSPTERELVKVIEAWKHAWMDEPDYFDRAFGIDANMKYDLARRLVKMKPIEKGKTDGE